MNQRLQSFDKGTYERPNQPYDCGHTCEGIRCLLGPTFQGQCQADLECEPVAKGKSWLCGRTKIQDGKCEQGPTPDGVCCHEIPQCSPVASLRVKRGRFVFWCLATFFGITLLSLSASWRNDVFAPGELTMQHAQIINTQDEQTRCNTCHGAADVSAVAWAASIFAPGATLGAPQAERCLKCHDRTIPAATATLPHGAAQAIMEAKTQSCCERLGRRPRSGLPALNDGQIACAACHREHHGSLHDLSAMSNVQCATCHQDNFEHFAKGHPDLGDWPYTRRTRIAFDHVSHQAKHFPGALKGFECRACHIQPETGAVIGVVGYEQACAQCHDEKIKQSFEDGLELVLLPTLDVNALKAEGFSIGEWPPAAQGDFDGAFPPLMRALLNTDPFARSALNQFDQTFEFMDIDPQSVDDLEAAADIAWGIKYLIYDLVAKGPSALADRLRLALDCELDENLAHQLSGRISVDTIQQLQRAWFPNLLREVPARRSAQPIPSPTIRSSSRPRTDSNITVGWRRDDAVFALAYQPAGHASEFLQTWIQSTGGSNRAELSDDIQSVWQSLTSNSSKGLCISCHSVDPSPTVPGAKRINWHARRWEPEHKTFTKFDHDPHVILPGLKDCAACHDLNMASSSSTSYEQADPLVFESSFLPMSKQHCATCHLPRVAGDYCTQCHNYHVNSW